MPSDGAPSSGHFEATPGLPTSSGAASTRTAESAASTLSQTISVRTMSATFDAPATPVTKEASIQLGGDSTHSTTMATDQAPNAYDFTVRDSKGRPFPMAQFRGRPTLVMNVASQCGISLSAYPMATELFDKYKDRGFTVVAFPCNFTGQEPGTEEEIAHFACSKFKAKFPMMKKVEVNGEKADPLWKWLQKAKPGFLGTEFIKWNFTSFLIGCNGQVVERFSPGVSVADVESALLPQLALSAVLQAAANASAPPAVTPAPVAVAPVIAPAPVASAPSPSATTASP